MEDPLQHSRDKECVKYYFHSLQVFYMQDEEVDDLLDHINKVKVLIDRLACLKIHVRKEVVVMISLESLPPIYIHLITALETMTMKELSMKYVMAHLMHEILKVNDKDPQGDDVEMVLHQGKGRNSY
jgi:hypothetical protein